MATNERTPPCIQIDLFFFVLGKTYEECSYPRTWNMANEWSKPYQYEIISLLFPKMLKIRSNLHEKGAIHFESPCMYFLFMFSRRESIWVWINCLNFLKLFLIRAQIKKINKGGLPLVWHHLVWHSTKNWQYYKVLL